MINDKELKKIWKKYIDKKIYRIIPLEQKKDVLKKGFNPQKDPYEKYNPKIKKMFKIIERLEKKGIVFETKWSHKTIPGSTIVKVSKRSIEGKCIDFVARKKQLKIFKKNWKGGCLATYAFKLSNFLLENSSELKPSELKLVKSLNEWSSQKMKGKFSTVYIRGSSEVFESAKFYYFNKEFKRYWASPFGSFEHFKKVIQKKGLEKYLPFLKDEKLFYLRVGQKIPSEEIKFLGLFK